MQEAAECVSGKKGAPRGPQGTQGIVVLSMGVFNTLCLDGTMDEWLTGVDEVEVPKRGGWCGLGRDVPGRAGVCVYVHHHSPHPRRSRSRN